MIFQDSREMSSAYKTLKEEIGNKAKIETDISRTTDQLMKVEDQNAFLDFCFLIDSQYFPLDLSPSLPFASSRLDRLDSPFASSSFSFSVSRSDDVQEIYHNVQLEEEGEGDGK